ILIFLSVIVISFGTAGNALVVGIVVKSKNMKTATNILIANLALADIMVLFFDLPLTLHYQLNRIWVHGIFLCHAFYMLFGVFECVSILSMTAIAIDRYVLIVRPLSTKLTPLNAVLLAAFIFLISTIVALPAGIFVKVTDLSNDKIGFRMVTCGDDWPDKGDWYRKIYTVAVILMMFVFPLFVIACLYTLIFNKIRQRIKSRSGSSSKTNRMLVTVVLVFVVSWVPHQLVTSVYEFFPYLDPDRETISMVDLYFRLLAFSSSCINPILYGYMNDNF
ncbi:hypothetical protein HELRODRAFT_133608, partial [Helobdella robusta]|uniref:G-protein coupled receptors family 1 profile domain-containing protein n=1 Tax=Helobdella robusta TaxID=6412 RepID=T1EI16_HELRO